MKQREKNKSSVFLVFRIF